MESRKVTMVAGSLVSIVTASKPRKINKEGINDSFLIDYITLMAKMLLCRRSNLNQVKFIYFGGHDDKVEDANTAKLYFNALNYYFEKLGFGKMSEDNLTIFDSEQFLKNPNDFKMSLKEADFVFMGIGEDKVLGERLKILEKEDILLEKWLIENNILVGSACAGSVLTAKNIYGGAYDSYFHNRDKFDYPKNYPAANFFEVTMEPNYYLKRVSQEEYDEFKNNCLLPDSFNKAFFACTSNSYIVQTDNLIYAVGEIYLLIAGCEYKICTKNSKSDITTLLELVNEYNVNEVKHELFRRIVKEIKRLIIRFDNSYDLVAISEYNDKESNRLKNVQDCIIDDLESLKRGTYLNKEIKIERMSPLFLRSLNIKEFEGLKRVDTDSETRTLSLEEKMPLYNRIKLEICNDGLTEEAKKKIYYKYGIISIVRKYSTIVSQYDLYRIFEMLPIEYSELVICFIECFSSMYKIDDMRSLLNRTQLGLKVNLKEINRNNNRRKNWSRRLEVG